MTAGGSTQRRAGTFRRHVGLVVGVALLVVGIGTAAAVAERAEVTVHADGATHEVRTFARTVDGVLDQLGLELEPGDVVDPTRETSVGDGLTVVIERAIGVTVVDGDATHELRAVVDDVDDALRRLGLRLGTADHVEPPLDAQVTDGLEVRIRRAITVEVVVDAGVARRVTAPVGTVAEVLEAAGMAWVRDRDARLEPGWDESIGDGGVVTIVFPTPVTVVADGDERRLATFADDVAGALEDAGVTVGDADLVTPDPHTPLLGATTITVRRVTFEEVAEEVTVEHDTEQRETAALERGRTRVEVAGRDGLRVDTYRVRLVDGEEQDRERIGEELVREPTTEVVLVGTGEPPASASASGSGAGPTGGSGSVGGTGSSGGGFLAAPGSAAAGSGTRVTYSVEVEAGLGLDPAGVAAVVDAALLDQRSWARTHRMERVADPNAARIRVLVASPATVDRLCAAIGLNTAGWLSCWTGRYAALNVDRWRSGTREITDVALYRRYLVNHEVGHGLGFGHVGCPAPGALAPVMQQQSLSLNGCRANGWPYPG
jgi:uncharacterized protein YabE (DUF348 family)